MSSGVPACGFAGAEVFAGHPKWPRGSLSPRRCPCSCERASWVKDRAEPGRRRRPCRRGAGGRMDGGLAPGRRPGQVMRPARAGEHG